jgi:photosystem II stability/assembly factor-like uncharacterized protein
MTEFDMQQLDRELDGLRDVGSQDLLLAALSAISATQWPDRAAGTRITQGVLTSAGAATADPLPAGAAGPGPVSLTGRVRAKRPDAAAPRRRRRILVTAGTVLAAAAATIVAVGLQPGSPRFRAAFTTTTAGTVRPSGSASGTGWRLVSYFQAKGWVANTLHADAANLSCPSAGTCYLTASAARPADGRNLIGVSHDGGSSWILLATPGGIGLSTPLRCPDGPAVCVAGGVDGGQPALLATRDGGRTWSARPIPGSASVQELACASTRRCVVIADVKDPFAGFRTVVLVTDDGGATFRPGPAVPAGQYPDMLGCAGRTCVLFAQKTTADTSSSVNGNGTPAVAPGPWSGFYSRDGGLTWQRAVRAGHFWPEFSNDAPMPDAISCADPRHCMALASSSPGVGGASGFIVTSDGGATWDDAPLAGPLAGRFFGLTLTCPTASQCVAGGETMTGTGYATTLAVTADGGATWRAVELPAPVRSFLKASIPGAYAACPEAGTCTVILEPQGTAGQTAVLSLRNG